MVTEDLQTKLSPHHYRFDNTLYMQELLRRNGTLLSYFIYFALVVSGVGVLSRVLFREGNLLEPFLTLFIIYGVLFFLREQVIRLFHGNTLVALYFVQAPAWIISVLLGTVLDPQNRTVTLFLFIALMPLFILDKPHRVEMYNVFWILTFIVIAWLVKPWDIFCVDMSFLMMFGAAALTSAGLILVERLDSIKLFVESYEKARTDSSTQLLNRYALSQDAESYVGEDLVMGIACIDDLAYFTEVYGHSMSDDIIQVWAKTLGTFFGFDHCYRYTVREVLLVLPHESPEHLEDLVAQCQAKFMQNTIASLQVQPHVSLGYVYGSATDIDDLMNMANHADIILHEAQRSGGSITRGAAYDRNVTKTDEFTKRHGYHITSDSLDPLTGLATMKAFNMRARSLLNDALERFDNRDVVLIYFNIENFKSYNEDYGRQAGDDLLRGVAHALSTAFDGRLVARFAADHFVVMCFESEYQDCLAQALNSTFSLHKRLNMPLKAGVYLYRDHAEDVSVACDRAKVACDSVKSRYDVFWRIYDDELRVAEERRTYIIAHVDDAVLNDWLRVYYQPIVDTKTGKVVECEALVRWIDPTYGFMPPFAFIGVLEHARLIHRVDFWVAEKVCSDYHERVQAGLKPLPVSINLSRSDFMQENVEKILLELTERYDVPHEHLHVEVTESALSDNFAQLAATTNRLRSQGFELWLDDFGSDYSSLTTLKDFPCDVIKLDLMFLRASDENKRARVIIEQAVQLAQRLGARCLCEGVEERHHLDFLTKIGCDYAQGYFFSKPEPLDVLTEKGLIP